MLYLALGWVHPNTKRCRCNKNETGQKVHPNHNKNNSCTCTNLFPSIHIFLNIDAVQFKTFSLSLYRKNWTLSPLIRTNSRGLIFHCISIDIPPFTLLLTRMGAQLTQNSLPRSSDNFVDTQNMWNINCYFNTISNKISNM